MSFAIFCRPSSSPVHSRKDCHIVANGKVHDAHRFGFFCLCSDRIFVVLAPFEAVTAPWSVQPNRYVDVETTQVGGVKGSPVCLCKRAHEGERVTGQLSHNTLSTAHEYNGTWSTSKKTAVRLPHHAGLCCTRCIAILSALRACENRIIANPGRVKNSIFHSAKQY